MRIIAPRITHQFALAIRAIVLTSLAVSPYMFMALPGDAKVENKQVQAPSGKKPKTHASALGRTKGAPGPDLPNLSTLRNAPAVQPQALPPVPSNLRCFDCDDRKALSDDFSVARTELRNRIGRAGVDPLSQNYHWNLPLVGLEGRAGLDLNLALVYDSLVWTTSGGSIAFDADRGQPSPGFNLGLPRIQPRYFNGRANSYSYLFTTSEGTRVEFRELGSTNTYQAVDGSNWRMTDNGADGALVKTSSGTELIFAWLNGQLQCRQVKDINGNYLTVQYDPAGRLSSITDTLRRTLSFNRDQGGNLLSITQRRDNRDYVWATFGYADLTINANVPGLNVIGPKNGTVIPVLSQVALNDGTFHKFDYASSGQIWRITRYAADGHALSRASYDFTPMDGTPRVSSQRTWAENWNNDQESVTSYQVERNGQWSEIILPNGTAVKQFFGGDGWQRGLPIRTETWAKNVLQKWTTTAWTQDDTRLDVRNNPRPEEINIYDREGNRRHQRFVYQAYGLAGDIYEYAGDGETVVRRTHTDYNFDQIYVKRNIIGLVSGRLIYDGQDHLFSKTTYEYDQGRLEEQGGAFQHDDERFGVSLVKGRGLESEVRQWDATDPGNVSKSVASQGGYLTTGSLAYFRDVRGRQSTFDYSDAFADGTQRDTFAYATSISDPDGNQSTSLYDYATGRVTRTRDQNGNIHSSEFDSAGRLLRFTDQPSGVSTHLIYSENGVLAASFAKAQSNAEETESYTVTDGAGRTRATAMDLPGSHGGYSGTYKTYDALGQIVGETNQTEMNVSWEAAGDDAGGWIWSTREYDWKGRPTLTVNQDGTTREENYDGCGCAGGEVVTLTDESGRSRTRSKDSLGRLTKVEELNWDGTVYATTEYTYDALDRMTRSNQSGQIRQWEYEGFGRLSAEVTPEQGRTEYEYNRDGSLKSVTDARGAKSAFRYDARNNLKGISYNGQGQVADTPAVSFGYDAQNRREWMQDGVGRVEYRYDERGQLKEETRRFKDLSQSVYTISYQFDGAEDLENVSTSWGEKVVYQHDRRKRLAAVSDNETPIVNGIEYRAWGAIKNLSYGNGRTLALEYDDRLRVARRNVAGVQGAEYGYDDFGENTGRVTRTRDLYDRSLDRFYQYDQVGRLQSAETGQAARSQTNAVELQNPASFSQQYRYDVWGNLVEKTGRPGEQSYLTTYKNNQIERDPLSGAKVNYDLAGNLIDDGQQQFTYDAAGHQRRARSRALDLKQDYGGDGLRAKKIEGSNTTYYVRSTVLGNQVVADLNGAGQVVRSYVYAGRDLVAVKDQIGLAWNHSDPVTKSKRWTNQNGVVINGLELDPWGNETANNSQSPQLKNDARTFTTYERDANGSDDAMHRRYNSRRGRFEQPDPFRGSVSPVNPQSLNRYSYTQNDPVNHTDPSGLMMQECWGWGLGDGGDYGTMCIDYDPWGGYGGGGGGPGGGGTGPTFPDVRNDFWNFLDTMSQDCKNALASYLTTLKSLAYSAPLYNVNQIGGTPASTYVGSFGNGYTTGQLFDMYHSGALTVVNVPKPGIYFRDPSTFIGANMYLLLHEMMHMAFPYPNSQGDLDQPLANLLGIYNRGGEGWSAANSRYFNSGCNPAELGP
jgi:RHS repeat-associated protein